MLRGFLVIQSLMVGFLLGYATLDWLNHCAFHQTELLGSLAARPSELLELYGHFNIVLCGPFETKLHCSMATRPSGLSGSLRTEMHGPFDTDLRGLFETKLHGSLATGPSRLSGSLRTKLHGPFETKLQGSFGPEFNGSFETKLHGSFETEMHGSLATGPSRLSGSLRTELHGPFETELQGSFETELHGNFETELHGSFETELHGFLCSIPRARSDPNGKSEPKPQVRPFNSFYFSVLLNFLFQKSHDPNPRPDPNSGS